MSITTDITPLSLYMDALERGDIQEDSAQHNVMVQLQMLFEDIRFYRPRGMKGERWSERILQKFANEPADQIKGFYLYGPVGRGKSLAMDLFYRAVSLPQKRRVHFHEFMQEVHDFIFDTRTSKQLSDEALPLFVEKMAEESWLLCFDEFQVTDVADAMLLKSLFSLMFEAGIIVVATSNTLPDSLYENGLQRESFLPFIDILKTHMNVVNVDGGQDYRAALHAQNGGQYLYPLSAEHTAQLKERLQCCLKKETLIPTEILVKGHKLRFETASATVLYASVDEILYQNLSANDCLAIAERFTDVFITDLVEFKDEEKDAARRFINLIDALYEKEVNLYILSDVAIDELYPKDGQLIEDFQRTASRLMEMAASKT